MAHFAEIDENNVVLRVLVVDNEQEHRGQEFLADELGLGGNWIQTSYNTFRGVHEYGGTPLRGNYACIGHIYNTDLDAFVEPKPFDSWILNEETFSWNPPIPDPSTEETFYIWDEDTVSWVEQ
jgi:hypothetical protein